VFDGLEQISPGILPEGYNEYKQVVYDLVNFLVYLSEPAKFQRQKIGIWVIIYLLSFLVIAFLLKKEYWKDIH
jgi:ubiquinol-cytochrome c reductase cytochrome c1 subunit